MASSISSCSVKASQKWPGGAGKQKLTEGLWAASHCNILWNAFSSEDCNQSMWQPCSSRPLLLKLTQRFEHFISGLFTSSQMFKPSDLVRQKPAVLTFVCFWICDMIKKRRRAGVSLTSSECSSFRRLLQEAKLSPEADSSWKQTDVVIKTGADTKRGSF